MVPSAHPRVLRAHSSLRPRCLPPADRSPFSRELCNPGRSVCLVPGHCAPASVLATMPSVSSEALQSGHLVNIQQRDE